MALILPKGIVVNTPQISGDIERIDKEPLASEELAKFWKGKLLYVSGRMKLEFMYLIVARSLYNHQTEIV